MRLFEQQFAKMITPLLGTKDLIGKNGKYLSDETENLLRRHHAKIRRMVAKLNHVTVSHFSHSLVCEGYRDACYDILEQLDAMAGKKGKP